MQATPIKKSRPRSRKSRFAVRPDDRAGLAEEDANYPILVHSHLRWDWVWQRPQQFLSRLSRRHPVLFVEEPLGVEGLAVPRAELREVTDLPNLMVLRTEVPPALLADRTALDAEQRRLVLATLESPLGARFTRPVQWFYDPMATISFAGQMNERAVVYDCMDQLSQFLGAPPELIRRERELLSVADVVFAGGPNIWEAKREFNANCHAYGCGVEVAHFARARAEETEIPADLASLPGPRLGFFGVVDERMDYELVGKLAAAHPEWSITIIGPACKVDPATFPKHGNLHWLGRREYDQLPAYVKGFDVCLMPFALNEATEYINPTKALEYMATGRPIVSTAVRDVVLQFSDVVAVTESHEAFLRACEQAVAAPDAACLRRGLEMAERRSWETVVTQLEEHIADALQSRRRSESCAA